MKIILSISISILLLASCKKSNQDLPLVSPAIPKIKTCKISKANTLLTELAYEYDNTGRLAKVTSADGSTVRYSYTTTAVTTESYNSNGIFQSKSTFTLNADGLAVTYFNNDLPLTVTHFAYNNAKQLVSEITEDDGDTTYQFYHTYNAMGNRVADTNYNGHVKTTSKKTYYTDKISSIENANAGISFYGASNTNAVQQSDLKISTSTQIPTTYAVPEMDAAGRIIKTVYTTQAITYTSLYTYY